MENIKKWKDPHKGKRVTAYIHDNQYEMLKKLCDDNHLSVTDGVRAAIMNLLSSGAADSIVVSSTEMYRYRSFTNQTKGDK